MNGAAWPGAAPTLDMVMFEIRQIGERLTYFSSIQKYDADFLRELADHKQDPARHAHPVVTERQKSNFVRMAEAQLLFGSYCDKEAQRLAEKARAMGQGTLDAEADDEARRRNEELAHRAIALAEAATPTKGDQQP
jgi:hypothetical protein